MFHSVIIDPLEATIAMATCLSPQVHDLVTKSNNEILQTVDYLDDQYTINLTLVKQQFGTGMR